ncbi:rab3 GTPase-activating protein non-catalytic subunit-like isoform X2 [Liolophura sinensis]|uniref:rab3 GTPase-activating protein non-catalytic subunit-like isoform X2 n=1 Tax=Liolophura sinensis TaxID=3198878 RepID=UPI0031590D44
MSCQLTALSHFHDLVAVKRFLFPELKDPTPEPTTDDDWGTADWGWKVEDEETTENDVMADLRQTWFQETIISLSPTNDLVAIANQDRIVFLTQKWDPTEKGEIQTKYCPVWQGSLRQEEREQITAVMCVPLASQKRSTQGGPDWTCILVGFSTGYVRFYTENGTLLMSQLLHEEPVIKLKCRTYEASRYLGMAEQHEELIILYKKALVTIDGFSFVQSLRACRNQVARAAASGGESSLQPPPLAYKKWGLQDQEGIFDQVSCGVTTPNPFDQMKTASILGGFKATIKPTPPAAAQYVTAGIGPYVGFFYAVEGSSQPLLSEVAYAVANKLRTAFMSAASGWLGFGGKPKVDHRDKRKPKVEPAAPLPLRFGLPDKRRQGESIVLSPSCNYAATTDSFGRVFLIDVESGTAVRMWKGYRDAQLGWIQVKDDGENKYEESVRTAQFLVIYAPRRGILEVWTAVNGPRVAAFNVSKWARLISPGYGMMGLNNVTIKSVKNKAFQVILVDPKGTVKTLEVPFHLALSDKNSKRARDLHLLKKLKTLLKEHTHNSDGLEKEVSEILLDMRVANIVRQALEKALNTRYLSPAVMLRLVKAVSLRLHDIAEADMDVEGRHLFQFCQGQESLLQTYISLNSLSTQEATHSENLSEHLTSLLLVNQSEIEHLLSQVEQFHSCVQESAGGHVSFDLNSCLNVVPYLHCFHLDHHSRESHIGKHGGLTLGKHMSEERKISLGRLVFGACLDRRVLPADLSVVLQSSGLGPDQLMDLLTHYWLSEDDRNPQSIEPLYYLMKAITCMTETSDVIVDPNTVSPWWQKLRDSCSRSERACAAILLAVVGRSVSLELLRNQTTAKDPDADTASTPPDENMDTSDWESITVDIEQWTNLIKQLEDVLAISTILKITPSSDNVGPVHSEAGVNGLGVSVAKFLEGGKGYVPEVVARYVCRTGLSSHVFNSPHKTPEEESSMETEEVEKGENSGVSDRLRSQFTELQSHFPYSLENDVLMANCAWEYAAQWNRDPESMMCLENSLHFMKLVQNAVLRQGVCSMFWHMFIAKRMMAAAYLMEKVGKPPKERLCRKEVGISDTLMVDFLRLTCDFLEILQDANCDANVVPVFNIEPLWQQVHGPASLVELSVEQRATNYGLVRHHYHLSLLMYFILHFNIKSVKVLSLFDSKGKNAFFNDLHAHPLLPNQNVDSSLSLARRQFLSRVLTQSVRDNDTLDTKWSSLVLELAKDFGLDIDYFKQHLVCELYSEGKDKMAEEVLSTVNDHELMGSQLLLVAGQRVAHYIYTCDPPGGLEKVASLSPTVSTWLKSMESVELRCPNVPLHNTAVLMGHVVNQLPEGYSEYNLAVSLVELVQSLL